MKNLDLNIQVLNQEAVETLFNVENEIRELYNNHYLDADLSEYINLDELLESEFLFADDEYSDTMTENEISEGEYPDDYYYELFRLKEKREELDGELFNELIKSFGFRGGKIKIKFLSDKIGLPLSSTEKLLELHSKPIIKEKGEYQVDCLDIFDFLKRLALMEHQLDSKIVSI